MERQQQSVRHQRIAPPLIFEGNAPRSEYRHEVQFSEASACTDCGAVYLAGRWQWAETPKNAIETRCVACRRLKEKAPAGHVTLQGQYAREHHDELLSLIRQVEADEKAAHPMQRIMSIERGADRLLVTTTDMLLARGIGKALQRTFKGTLDFRFNKSEYLLRVHWQR